MPDTYMIHSAVRKRHTRMARAKAPSRHRFVQRLAGGTIVVRRNRPARVTAKKLKECLAELKTAAAEGRIDVKTETGQLVDLTTMTIAAVPITPPKPAPPTSSVATDKQVGTPKPMYPEGKAQDEVAATPAITQPDIPDGIDPDEELPSSPGKKSKRRKKG